MPSCLGASGLVRAMQKPHWACWATDVQIFWPVSLKPPSTRSAFIDSAARSEPAPGSENSWHQTISPRRVGRRKRSFCSSEP